MDSRGDLHKSNPFCWCVYHTAFQVGCPLAQFFSKPPLSGTRIFLTVRTCTLNHTECEGTIPHLWHHTIPRRKSIQTSGKSFANILMFVVLIHGAFASISSLKFSIAIRAEVAEQLTSIEGGGIKVEPPERLQLLDLIEFSRLLRSKAATPTYATGRLTLTRRRLLVRSLAQARALLCPVSGNTALGAVEQ